MKLYVLVRKDLSLSQIAVQAGHAVGEWVKSYPLSANQDWDDTLVYLGVKDEDELADWYDRLKEFDYCVDWREAYWNNSLTSMAILENPLVKLQLKSLQLV